MRRYPINFPENAANFLLQCGFLCGTIIDTVK